MKNRRRASGWALIVSGVLFLAASAVGYVSDGKPLNPAFLPIGIAMVAVGAAVVRRSRREG